MLMQLPLIKKAINALTMPSQSIDDAFIAGEDDDELAIAQNLVIWFKELGWDALCRGTNKHQPDIFRRLKK